MITYKKVIDYYIEQPEWMDNTNRYMSEVKFKGLAGPYTGLANRFEKRRNGDSKGIKKAKDDEFVYFILNERGYNELWNKIENPIIKDEKINQKWHLLIAYIAYGLYVAERIRSNPKESNKWEDISKIQGEEVTFDYYENRCKCPELMLWMAEAAGHKSIKEATNKAIEMHHNNKSSRQICKELLSIITWNEIKGKIDA